MQMKFGQTPGFKIKPSAGGAVGYCKGNLSGLLERPSREVEFQAHYYDNTKKVVKGVPKAMPIMIYSNSPSARKDTFPYCRVEKWLGLGWGDGYAHTKRS